MEEKLILEGTVENIVFQNADNGYVVFNLLIKKEKITCVAFVPQIVEGEYMKVSGNYINHSSYGKQFSVSNYEKSVPSTLDGLEKYLSSGIIKGIGKKLAKSIIKKFGKETIIVIEEQPEKLAEIKGITMEKAITIGQIFHEHAEYRKVMMFLQDYNITPTYAMRIYKKYKSNTLTVIQTNPYLLANDIYGIGFKTADDIAEKVGITRDSSFRIKAYLKYILSKASRNGHVYLPKETLLSEADSYLRLPLILVENSLSELILSNEFSIDTIKNNDVIYLNNYYYAENYIAKKLLELSSTISEIEDMSKEKIVQFEKFNAIELASKQKQAVLEALVSGVLVITGGPGTGKTTIINAIINILKEDGNTVELAAPTGRAAKKMTETTGIEAKTIHRLLGITFLDTENRNQSFDKNEENPIESDVLIIDESSMIDVLLMRALLRAIPNGTRLILVGDVDQLPSVGPGNILRDIINSNCINVVRLTEIFRQAKKSAIVVNAHRINNGNYPILNDKNNDFFFMRRDSPDAVVNTIVELVTKRLTSFVDCTANEIQVLSPMRKTDLGVYNLNRILQENLNPPSSNKKEKEFRNTIFRVGDKVMQLKNNYNISYFVLDSRGNIIDDGVGVFNGDEGIIKNIDDDSETITIIFDDNKYIKYEFNQLDELDLSYATTIHKSQGSEYKVVIIPIFSGPPMLMNRNLLYTAVTRAKKLVVVVGREGVLFSMVDNKREIDRYSSLDLKIKALSKILE